MIQCLVLHRFGRSGMHRETGLRTFADEVVDDDLVRNERLGNDLSWRRFTDLGLRDGTPDHSTISRFRSLMVERDLTPAHVNDTLTCDELIQGDEEVLYADAAY